MTESALIAYLPILLLAIAMLLLLPAPLLAVHRNQAAVATLAVLLGAGFIRVVWLEDASPQPLFLLPCMALLIAAPLLERARFFGLALAGLAGSAALLYGIPHWLATHLPERPVTILFPVALVASLATGKLGGMKLPLHPQRHRADGTAVWHGAPQAVMLAGWICLGLAFALFHGESFTLSHATAALTAGIVTLLHAQTGHGEDALQKSGEGLIAGFLITLLAPLTPLAAIIAGLVAAFFVTRSEAIALSLRFADPHHFFGALFMPAMLGLLLPGLLDLPLLAGQIQWLGAALGFAALLSLILWPLTMFLLGVALPPRLVREGVQPH